MPRGRPETVTVMFTDLVGSTAWRTRVGELVADDETIEISERLGMRLVHREASELAAIATS